MELDLLWQGIDQEGIESFIVREQWNIHVAKRAEISAVLDLTIRAMVKPVS